MMVALREVPEGFRETSQEVAQAVRPGATSKSGWLECVRCSTVISAAGISVTAHRRWCERQETVSTAPPPLPAPYRNRAARGTGTETPAEKAYGGPAAGAGPADFPVGTEVIVRPAPLVINGREFPQSPWRGKVHTYDPRGTGAYMIEVRTGASRFAIWATIDHAHGMAWLPNGERARRRAVRLRTRRA